MSPSPTSTVTKTRTADKKSIDEVLGRWDKKARVYSSETARDTDKRALATFSKYDPQGRGVIAKSDVQLGLRDLGIEVSAEQAAAALAQVGVTEKDQVDLPSFIKAADSFKVGIAGQAKEQTIAESLWELAVLAAQKAPSMLVKMITSKTQKDDTWVQELSADMKESKNAGSEPRDSSKTHEDEKGTSSLK